MEERSPHNDGSFLTGLVLGGVIGAALVVVFSKDEGEEVRGTLVKKGKTALKNLGNFLEEEKIGLDEVKRLKEYFGEKEEISEEDEAEKEEGESEKDLRKFFSRKGKKLK